MLLAKTNSDVNIPSENNTIDMLFKSRYLLIVRWFINNLPLILLLNVKSSSTEELIS